MPGATRSYEFVSGIETSAQPDTASTYGDWDAIVGSDSFCTHSTLAAALAAVGNDSRILVKADAALASTITIDETDVDIYFYPGVVYSKDSATTGIDIAAAAARIRIYGGKFSGFSTGGDIAINVNASAGVVMLRDMVFASNDTDVADNGNTKLSSTGHVTE